MKLQAIEIEGFRSFSSKVRLDLSADVVILSGPNGTGKTSILDSILWVLSGKVPRLGKDAGNVLSRYAPHGFAEVNVSLVNGAGDAFSVRRRFDGSTSTVSVEQGKELIKGKRAELFLCEQLWPHSNEGDDNYDSFGEMLAQFVYLQQDLVTKFIEVQDETERFEAVGDLVGIGRLNDLQRKLESARNAWSRTTNQKSQDLEEKKTQLNKLRLHLERLSNQEQLLPDDIPVAWVNWWAKVSELLPSWSSTPAVDSSESTGNLDSCLRELQTEIAAANRKREVLQGLSGQLVRVQALSPPSKQEIEAAESRIEGLTQNLSALKNQFVQAKERSAEEQTRILALQQSDEEFQVFASLALRHLEESCPVCKQSYDREEARRRLEGIAARQLARTSSEPEAEAIVQKLTVDLNAVQLSRLVEQQNLWEMTRTRSEYDAGMTTIRRGLQDLGLPASDVIDINLLQSAQDLLLRRLEKLKELYAEGEQLTVTLARLGERSQRVEIQAQLTELESQVELLTSQVDGYMRTGKTASQMIESLRDVTRMAINRQIESAGPLLTRIYSRIDPHPAFTIAKFKAWQSHGRGRMNVTVEDSVMEVKDQDPILVLSSSQKNALAVSLFLTFNLGSAAMPFQVAMLDDPLQNLDDVNLLGLIDVLRRLRSKRQLFISTHDSRFSQLLCRKLRPIKEDQETLVVRLDSWSREGPEFSVSAVEHPQPGLRVLTA